MMRIASIFLLSVSLAWADTRTDHFVTPAGAGSADGSSWANAWSLANLNTSGNWGAGEAKITAGETVYLSGGSSSALYGDTVDVQLGGVTFKPGAAHPTLSSGHDGQVQIFAAGVAIENNTLTNVVWDGRWSGSYTNRRTLPSVADFKIWARSTNSVGVHWKGSWNQFYSIAAVACGDTEDVDHGFQSNPSAGQETVGTIIDGCFSAMNYGDGFNVNRANTNSATNFVLRSSYIYSNRVDGIQIPGGLTYTNNIIDGTGNQDAAHGDGIQCAGGNIVIAGNTFRNWPQSIFNESGGSDTYMGNVRIFNNEFYRTADYTTYMLAVSLKAKFTSAGQTVFMENLLVANNTVQNTYDRHGVRIQYAPTPDAGTFIITNSRIVNNIFNDIVSSSHPVAVDDAVIATDASLTIQTNNVFGNETFNWDGTDYASISALVAARPTFTGNTNAAPVFVATNSYNLEIDASDVYVKSAGVPVTGVEVDIFGRTRSTSTPTIGAFEFQSGGGGGDPAPPNDPRPFQFLRGFRLQGAR